MLVRLATLPSSELNDQVVEFKDEENVSLKGDSSSNVEPMDPLLKECKFKKTSLADFAFNFNFYSEDTQNNVNSDQANVISKGKKFSDFIMPKGRS